MLIREGDDAVVRAVADRIRRDCGGTVRISDLVAFSGYSQTRFFTLFREKMGLSPNSFLTRCRIDKAKQLLSDPARRIHEVAEDVGYTDVAHFSKSFKKYVGCTPGEYRNGVRPGEEANGSGEDKA